MERAAKIALIWTLGIAKAMYKSGFPVNRGVCKYMPTCSEYAEQALRELRVLQALKKISIRVLSCNPWSKGGYDPVHSENRKVICE